MKPTIKIIVAGPQAEQATEFVRSLSDVELTPHERKVPNPLSATKEEAALPLWVGRVEWEDVAVQMSALTAYKRYDFVWAALLREAQGILLTIDSADAQALDDARRLLKLFTRLQQSRYVVAVKQVPAGEGQSLPALQEDLGGAACPFVTYSTADRASMEAAVRAALSRMTRPEDAARRRID